MSEQSQYSFVLASASPRRKELLTQAGYDFIVVKPDIDEKALPSRGFKADDYAKWLALAKAKNVAQDQEFRDSLIIGADTIVDFKGEIIGKPEDAKDAEKIIKKVFSARHKVITGIAIVKASEGIAMIDSDTTTIYPKKLTPEQIEQHIASGAWKDKAGAYAIQENGDEFVEKVNGSMTNVMGMPMELLKSNLAKVGIFTKRKREDS